MPLLAKVINQEPAQPMQQNVQKPYAATDEKNNTYGSMQIDDMVKAHDTFSSQSEIDIGIEWMMFINIM